MSSNVYPFEHKKTGPAKVDAGGEPPHDGDMRERVAKLEAGMDTIRAEIRAAGAETREAVLSAVERLRADGEKVRADTMIQIHGFKVWVLAGVLGFLVTALLAIAGIVFKPTSAPQIIQVPPYPAQPPRSNIGAVQPGDTWIPASGSTPPQLIHKEPNPSHP